MKQKLLHYWLAMNASALQAGAHAVKAFMGLALAHSVMDIPALNWKQAAIVFAFAFVYEVVSWLDTHPLPAPSASSVPQIANRKS